MKMLVSFYDSHCFMLCVDAYTSVLHNSENSKGQIININLPWAAKFYLFRCRDFVVVLKKFFERQLFTGGRAFAKFSTIEKTLATARKAFADRRAARWPYVMQA